MENSQGPLALLQRSAAHPIKNAQEIIEIIKKQPHLFQFEDQENQASPAKNHNDQLPLNLTKDQERLFKTLSKTRPRSLSQIHEKSKLSTQKVLENLSLLEIQGFIKNKNGKILRNC